jgi:BirA family biotin operon repressor/biotin-[acetyl-CoA-carboxylase] ligase
LDELERFGFVFESHPYRGIAYRGPATRLCPDQIEHELGTRRVGRRIAVWNRVVSTNDLAAHAAASTANEGLVILAEEQTAGRGRRGRQWVAPASSSLLMSVLLFPSEGLAEAGWLTALGAVAVAEVVAAWTGLDARIKWPNDVRIAGRKIAGILVERGDGAVIGVGLNANASLDDFPEELHETATSLRILMGEPVDRSELARALIRRLDDWYDRGRSLGPDALNPAWRDRSEHLGRMVRVATPSGAYVGRLVDLDLRRGLTLANPGSPSEADRNGLERRFSVRDVLALTPCDDGPGQL